ncbi:hypothetical protein [Burkholderia cenocepacia]|uniref:hypothetical protein n=1 Tax=Burkholderia cenocepacia TaxID=95486 RepID=UPI002874EB17|nr:hypothetical protein [Burkholderia cenocepacia]MDS0849320.1 hypothetical protein [Burkholderia cenocepacia]
MKSFLMRAVVALTVLCALPSHAQFSPGQPLTASQLNASFSNVLPLSGGTLNGPLTAPSATLGNATVNSAITGAATMQLSGTSSAALTTDQSQLTAQLNNPTATAHAIYGAAVGAAGQPVFDAAAVRGVATQTPGSTNWTVDGISGFVLNQQAGGNATQSAVGVFGVNICAVDHCQSWGMSSITSDAYGFTGPTTGVGRQLYGNESDLNVSSPNTNGIAYFAGGTALTPSAYLVGFQVNQLAGGVGAKWSRAFVSPDGAAGTFAYVGLQNPGASQSSQPIQFAVTDSSGNESYPELLATPSGMQMTASALIPGSANSTALGLPTLPWGTLWATSANITDTSTSNQATLTVAAPNDAQGASIKLTGNGSTTPGKTLRVRNGNLECINSAYNNVICTMTDTGSLALSGGLNNTAVGNTNPSTGAFTSVTIGGTAVLPNLSGTSGSIGGSALSAGACSSGTVSISGATTSMVARATPVTYPGDGNLWEAYVSSANTVTVKVCAIVAGTPAASAYNVRVLQ